MRFGTQFVGFAITIFDVRVVDLQRSAGLSAMEHTKADKTISGKNTPLSHQISRQLALRVIMPSVRTTSPVFARSIVFMVLESIL